MRHFLKRPPRRETPFKRHLSSLNLPSVASSSSVAPVQTHTHGEGGQSESSLVNPFLLPRSLARLDGRIDSMAELFGQSSVTKSILHFKGDAANGQPAQARRRPIASPSTYLEYHRKSDQIELGKTRDHSAHSQRGEAHNWRAIDQEKRCFLTKVEVGSCCGKEILCYPVPRERN